MSLPERQTVLIRGACVMTMDPSLGDLPHGDILLHDGRIAFVGARCEERADTEIDGSGMLALPGLVDTHTHLWTSQMRGRFTDAADGIYFRMRNRLVRGYTAHDMHVGTLLGAAECLAGGITTVSDFCHNADGEEVVHACLRAHAQVGLRARFLLGATPAATPAVPIDLGLLQCLAGAWDRVAGDAPLALGLAWRGPLGVTGIEAGRRESPALAVARQEFEAARALSLPISVHVSGINAPAQFEQLVRGGFLGPDVQLIHMSNASPAQLRLAAEAGAPVSLTPFTELRVGYGVTQLGDYLASGVRLGVGIDSNSLAGSADMFGVLKLFQLLECGRTRNERAIPARRLLELATIDGARSLGMEAEIGSLTPGKQADLILVDTNALNLAGAVDDPAHLLVEAARPDNVDTVIVAGRILKRRGRLVHLDPRAIVADASASIRAVERRAAA